MGRASLVDSECGLIDQLASTHGVAGFGLLIDCRSAACTPVAMPADAAIFIVHSGVQRGLVESEYNTRRAQCMAAATHNSVAALRDFDETQLGARTGGRNPVTFRRAHHVVTDNALTLAMAEALESDGGARMTGGGFGGCVVAVCSAERVEAALRGHWARTGAVSPLQAVVAPSQAAQFL